MAMLYSNRVRSLDDDYANTVFKVRGVVVPVTIGGSTLGSKDPHIHIYIENEVCCQILRSVL